MEDICQACVTDARRKTAVTRRLLVIELSTKKFLIGGPSTMNDELPDKADKEAKPLDLIYRLTTNQLHKSSRAADHKVHRFNTWRASLPDHCWECSHYDSCYPTKQCKYNPYYK